MENEEKPETENGEIYGFYPVIKFILPVFMRKWWLLHREVLDYLIAGGLTTAVNFAVYIPLCTLAGMNVVNANNISWTAAVVFAFFVNRFLVFEPDVSDKKHTSWLVSLSVQFISFVLMRIFSLIAEDIVLYITVSLLSFNNILMKITAQIMVVVLNYLTGKYITFRK